MINFDFMLKTGIIWALFFLVFYYNFLLKNNSLPFLSNLIIH